MTTTIVREMELDEVDPVVDLHLEGLTQELVSLNQVFPGKSVDHAGRPQLTRILTDMIKNKEGHVFVAVTPKTYAGYCLVTKKVYPVENPKLCGSVSGIYVREEFRRQKLGSELFQAAMTWLKIEGVAYVELYHIINDTRAATFWQAMGFTPVQTSCAKKL